MPRKIDNIKALREVGLLKQIGVWLQQQFVYNLHYELELKDNGDILITSAHGERRIPKDQVDMVFSQLFR